MSFGIGACPDDPYIAIVVSPLTGDANAVTMAEAIKMAAEIGGRTKETENDS